jgi:hypothetical protein
VAVVISVAVAIIVALVLVVALAVYVRRAPDPTAPYDVQVRLYQIHKRMDVALFRLETRQEADQIRRELNNDLGKHGGER